MALSGTDRGVGTHNTSASSFTLAPASNFAAGAMAVLVVAADNSGASGAYSLTTVTDTKGNTWTRQQSPLYDPGAANAGVQGAIFTTPQDGGTLTTGDTITVNFSAATVAKAWTLMEVDAPGNPTYVTGGVNTGAATATPTVTTGSITSGDMVIGGLFNEQGTGQTITGDADTTNGSWSTQQTAEIGSTAAGMTVSSQRKVVSATATQTYNPTLGVSSDVILAYIVVTEVAVVSGSGALDLDAPAVAGAAKESFIASGGIDLNAPAVASSGTERMLGSGGIEIDAPAVSGSGTHTQSGATGTGAVSIDAPTVAASGTERLIGSAALDLDAPAIAASGTERLVGSGGVSLDAPGVSSSGSTPLAVERHYGGLPLGAAVITGPAQPRLATRRRRTGRAAVTLAAPALHGKGMVNDDNLVLVLL